ncbi:zinc-dependent metalloprotease, partial [Streptomyces sp. SID3343]|uniref:zinc-dependent metalloprotease n=1 Tax=Streptomyces sp. SID3343 TaxID=2690260 RepID=UPI00136D4E96
QTFATLVGLELRPRRLRDASRLWASLADARGVDGRDAVWQHPDLLPTADDLDDPDGFVHHAELDLSGLDAELDADLDSLETKSDVDEKSDRVEPEDEDKGEGEGGPDLGKKGPQA